MWTRVLRAVSRRLTALARAADTVARYGGNGFILLPESAGEAEARQAARRILERFLETLRLPEAQVRIDLTAGVALFPAPAGACGGGTGPVDASGSWHGAAG